MLADREHSILMEEKAKIGINDSFYSTDTQGSTDRDSQELTVLQQKTKVVFNRKVGPKESLFIIFMLNIIAVQLFPISEFEFNS